MTFTTTTKVPVDKEDGLDISNGDFYPAIVIADARAKIRIDGTLTAERLREQLIEAMATANKELAEWQAEQLKNGYATLKDVPGIAIDGESVLLHRYRRAVYCWAKANLVERYRDYDSTNDGNQRADELEPTVGDLRRDYRWAISDIIGQSRNTTELI